MTGALARIPAVLISLTETAANNATARTCGIAPGFKHSDDQRRRKKPTDSIKILKGRPIALQACRGNHTGLHALISGKAFEGRHFQP